MAPPWSAEHEVTAAQARVWIEAQFPELAPVRVARLGVGWDNTAFRVNRAYVFRFPRRQIAVELLEREVRLLPFLAPRLPLPIPVPIYWGAPNDRFPWPFAGYRLLAGRTACTLVLDDGQRCALAEPLARFLAALHAVPPEDARRMGARPDIIDRLNVAQRVSRMRQRLEQLASSGMVADVGGLFSIVEAAEALSSPEPRSLAHGDLYARHLLIDAAGRLSGVIDWGDVHLGHPSADLALAHSFLPPTAHTAFRQAYGPIDEDTWRLARFRALDHSLNITLYARQVGDANLLREGRQSLRYLAAP